MTERDFEVRDVIFHNKLPQEETPDIYDFMKQHFDLKKTHNQTEHLKFLREKC